MSFNSLKISLYIGIFTILISIVFVIFNEIDLAVSARYYTPGAGFTFNDTELAILLKQVVRPTFKLATILSLLFVLLLSFIMPQAMKSMYNASGNEEHAQTCLVPLYLHSARAGFDGGGCFEKRLWSGAPTRYY